MILVYLKMFFMLPIVLFKYIKDKKKKEIHLFGLEGFVGLPGKGKTMCMTYTLDDLREQYGDSIYITTNYFYDKQDFPFTNWEQLLKTYDKPLVVGWDELQNDLRARDFKNFNPALLGLLTQFRKGNGIKIYYTCQRWHFVDKYVRDLTFDIWDCNTILGNFTYARRYDPVDFEHLMEETDYKKRMKIHPKMCISFLQTDKLRNSYDSYQMLESAKSKEYMTRQEMAAIDFSNIEF